MIYIHLYICLVICLIFITLFFMKSFKCQQNLEKNVNDCIKNSILPQFLTVSLDAKNVIELALNIWKMQKRLDKYYSTTSSAISHRAVDSSFNNIIKQLEIMQIEIIDPIGKKYNSGMNLDVIGDVKEDDIITETIVPTIIFKNQIVKKAQVVLGGFNNE